MGSGAGAGGGAGAAAGGGTSEYVRNELRAVVGARSARPDLQPQMQSPDLDPLMTFDMPASGELTFRFASTARSPPTSGGRCTVTSLRLN